MKRFYLFFLLVIGTLTNVNANQQKQSYLNVGDWFECEMEFIDNVPVFRNHWANNDSISPTQCYIVTRFSLKERLNNSTEIWSYKIIRHRSLSHGFSAKHENDETKLYCFDTWYPNYLSENIDSIRQNLTGEIRLINGELDNHKYNYGEFSFSLTTLFTENKQGSFYSSSLSGLDISVHLQVENIVSLVFSTKNLNKEKGKLGNRYYVDNLNFIPANSVSFNIKTHNSQSTPNTYKAYFEPHGLAYAFTDKYQQKVLAITQASFDIPNKAIITLIDAREKPEMVNENLYLVRLWPQNQSYAISKKEKELNGKTQYTYELKCGVEFIVNAGTASIRPIDLFVCPGDSIQIIIQDSTVLFQGKSYTIDTNQFLLAVQKAIKSIEMKAENIRLKNLIFNTNQTNNKKRIALPFIDSIEFVEVGNIVRLEADGSYTRFYLSNNEELMVSGSLKDFVELLTPYGFIRTHQAHLVNPEYIKRMVKSDGGYLILHHGANVPISRLRKNDVINLLRG